MFLLHLNFGIFKDNQHIFQVERNNVLLSKNVTGFFASNNEIQLNKPADVHSGDFLLSNDERYFVVSIQSLPNYLIASYKSNIEYQQMRKNNQQINIGSITGNAVVGSQEKVIFNIKCTFTDLQKLIDEKPIEDQERLNKLMDRIQTAVEENQPVSKGTFSHYLDLIEKYSDIAQALGNIITKWVFGVC